MCSRLEEELGYILMDFKAERVNVANTILRIEQKIVQVLGLGLYHAHEEVEHRADVCRQIDAIFAEEKKPL